MDRIQRLVHRVNAQRRRWFHLNFYRCHLAFFVAAIVAGAGALPGARAVGGVGGVRYIDAFVLAASAMTATGLNPVNLAGLTAYQQSVLFVLMLLGDLSTASISVVVMRVFFFRRRLVEKVQHSAAARRLAERLDEERARHPAHHHPGLRPRRPLMPGSSGARRAAASAAAAKTAPRHFRHLGGVTSPWETGVWGRGVARLSAWLRRHDLTPGHHHYLSFRPQLDRKGRFRNLSEAECEELGGVEYRALRLLCWILPSYTVSWIALTILLLASYASLYAPVADKLRAPESGNLSPGWWGVFVALSSYTNCGFSLLSASMVPFRGTWFVLIVSGTAILAGNTFYPIFLRCYVWALSRLVPKGSETHHSLLFLLHHPRRCYLWIFDHKTTLVLAATQLGLILTEWLLFEVLDIHQTAVWALSPGTRAMNGLYQSLNTRNAGFYIVTTSSIAPAMQIVNLFVMYISVFPLLISLRTTNIYEERSVGLDAEEYEAQETEKQEQSLGGRGGQGLAGTHIRNQLAYDLWWIMLSWFLICLVEEPRLNTSAPGYSPFTILFEVVSAYGNCGLSLGVPNDEYALCGTFRTLSKLVLVTVMLRGRHRILPLAIDRSIMIPGEATMAVLDQESAGGPVDSPDAPHKDGEGRSSQQVTDTRTS